MQSLYIVILPREGQSMDKIEAMELLNEICESCPELAEKGFYTREIRSSPVGNVELRLLASLDRESKKSLNSIVSKHGLKLIVATDLLIIY
jgi:hypothetical protein